MPRMLIVAHYLPHRHTTATSTILENLFENLPPEDLLVIGRGGVHDKPLPPYATQELPRPPRRGSRFTSLAYAPWHAVLGARAARRFGAEVIVATFPDDVSLLTAYLIHK